MTRFDIIKYYIDKYDYNGLLAMGLSSSIFDNVSKTLAEVISEDEEAWVIAEKIANVIDVEYGEEPCATKFFDMASAIRIDLRRLANKIVINEENLVEIRKIIPNVDEIYKQNDLDLLIDELDDFVFSEIILNDDEPTDIAYKYDGIRNELFNDNCQYEIYNRELWGNKE